MSPLRATLSGAAQNLIESLADIDDADAEGMDADLSPGTHLKRFVFEFAEGDRASLKRDRRSVWRTDPVDGST